jgi:hypothetical protein
MRTLAVVLAVVAWSAALVATLGAAMVRPTFMGIAGIVAALAAIGWGMLAVLERPDAPEFTAPTGPVVTEIVHTPARAVTVIEGGREARWLDDFDPEPELPYRPVEHSPFWDTDIWGAVE